MRAVAMTPAGLAVVDKPEPQPAAGEVVVTVEWCGICGSDLHLARSGMLPPGAVLGHELAGTVVAEGAGASLAVGTRVAVLPARRCGECPACTEGRDNLCPQQLVTSIGLGLDDGGYAERVAVPAVSCHPLPGSTTADQGAMAEPYAVALHALGRSRASTDPGVAVAVVGAGSVGLMCVAALRRAGVERVAVAEPRPSRAAVARSMGAAVVGDASSVARALGAAPDVVFEAAGAASTPGVAVEIAATGGQVVLLGAGAPGEAVGLPALLWLVKEVDVKPSIAYTTAEFAAAVTAVGDGAADAVLTASERRPLAGAPEAHEDLARADGPVKVLLAPGG